MRYKCKTISLDKLLVDFNGINLGLCNDCGCLDCSNPIEKKKISVMGIEQECRVFSKGIDVNIVITCEGFVHEK
ncbi:MAG: hypothetical protein J7L15_05905 [Clostridiales bacterium]|nr:hypothetical protein [Clostridiales bacterium]